MHKLGKKPYEPDERDLKLAHYMDLAVPTAPEIFGFGRMFTDWSMLGNDQWGSCVFSGAAHETMIWTKVRHGLGVDFDDHAVLSDYSAVTGFDENAGPPGDNPTDQGTYPREALLYRKHTGLVDARGGRHKIGAFVALDPKNWDHLVRASYIFGAVGIGFEFPDTAWAEFDNGTPWDDVDPSAEILGGHYVPVVGSMHSDTKATCVTWGRRQELTRSFFERYCDEAWAILSLEQIHNGIGLHNFDLTTFTKDLNALAG